MVAFRLTKTPDPGTGQNQHPYMLSSFVHDPTLSTSTHSFDEYPFLGIGCIPIVNNATQLAVKCET